MSPHRQQADTTELGRNRFAEALAGIALGIVIGMSLATALFYGWST